VLLHKICATGTMDCQSGIGSPCSLTAAENIDTVYYLASSQENAHAIHCVSSKIGLNQGTVIRIIREDLNLKCLNLKTSCQRIHCSKLWHTIGTEQAAAEQLFRPCHKFVVTDDKMFTDQCSEWSCLHVLNNTECIFSPCTCYFFVTGIENLFFTG